MSRRIAQSSINWAAIAERVPPNQKTNFTAFKSKSDKYLRRWVWENENFGWIIAAKQMENKESRQQCCVYLAFRVMSNPENAPKIDWAAYKSKVPIAGMVDAFQKQYESIKIPYPADTVSSTVDAQRSQVEQEIKAFIAQSNSRIGELEKQIQHLKSMLPFEQMTMEDFKDAYPDQAIDPINNPTFWPHEPLTDEEIKAIEEAKNNPHH